MALLLVVELLQQVMVGLQLVIARLHLVVRVVLLVKISMQLGHTIKFFTCAKHQ